MLKTLCGSMDALTYFDSGFNCAEAVLQALCAFLKDNCKSEYGCIPKIATGFGGGMKTGSVCGAVSGAVMALGLQYGRENLHEPQKRDRCSQAVSEFMEQFKKEHKTILCQTLLGVDLRTEEGRRIYREANLKNQCRTYVATAFEIAQTLLAAE